MLRELTQMRNIKTGEDTGVNHPGASRHPSPEGNFDGRCVGVDVLVDTSTNCSLRSTVYSLQICLECVVENCLFACKNVYWYVDWHDMPIGLKYS